MPNDANECFCKSGMLVNQLVTSDAFFHWLSFVVFLIFELILSRICLLTLLSSLFAGFMRRHIGWLAKLSLYSFRVIKACCLGVCSVRSLMLSSWAMDLLVSQRCWRRRCWLSCRWLWRCPSGVFRAPFCQACKSLKFCPQEWRLLSISLFCWCLHWVFFWNLLLTLINFMLCTMSTWSVSNLSSSLFCGGYFLDLNPKLSLFVASLLSWALRSKMALSTFSIRLFR